jgi:Brp/Blh family beta-carotene 15,15'-monooxygenase
MLTSEHVLLTRVQWISRVSVVAGIVISLPLGVLFPDQLTWQIVLAVSALAIGIPHGAVDHVIAVPQMNRSRQALFFASYLLLTGLVIWFILTFNLLGFQLIVVLSALHFGVGDASFIAEIDKISPSRRFPKIWYALAAGFTPVLLPLVSSQSQVALHAVNPALVGWSGPVAVQLFLACVCLNLVTVAILLVKKRPHEALELLILLALATLTPPLVAFGIYFGFWHALRHTARLSLELESARHDHQRGRPWVAFGKAVLAGVPAVVVVLLFTAWLGLVNGLSISSTFLWFLLVVVWALTVPHMILTARLDARAMGWTKTGVPQKSFRDNVSRVP